ncbi:MAG TPA: outer membrane beta-barrel protein [Paludibacteraceae bacterium]|nr:outer membrane beta-barrel protein [Paludibacteraceae bacterium]HQB68917.1 outer membrane beta-barrel protein [Paludibacteraceae bacterium]HRS67226.1 outer membrane beta-barrel protein [Paludibacteraceae bacterium]
MKRLFLVLLLSAFVIGGVLAQRLGAVAGYQLNTPFPSTNVDGVNFNERVGSGFHVGLLADWDMTTRWGLELGAMYSLRSSSYNLSYTSDTTTIFKRQLYYLDVPLHVYVNFPIKKWALALYVGPSFNVGLHGKDIAWENTPMQKPVTLETEDMYGDDGRLNRFEIAAELGLTAKYKNYEVRASYQIGVNDVTKDNYRWTLDLPTGSKTYFNQGELKLSVAYLFDLGK